MKKIALIIVALVMSVAANAQFEQGKIYANASLSGLDFSNNKIMGSHFEVGTKIGYFLWEDVSIVARLNYNYYKNDFDIFNAQLGGQYYITQNGLFLGAGLNFMVFDGTDVAPSFQLGYAFFLNEKVTIEPEVYYNQSLTNSDYSTFGFRIGLGIYF